jgi:hypothetical protein
MARYTAASKVKEARAPGCARTDDIGRSQRFLENENWCVTSPRASSANDAPSNTSRLATTRFAKRRPARFRRRAARHRQTRGMLVV